MESTLMTDPTSPEKYLAMDRRTFGEYVDRYVKESNATKPLSPAARECMESPEVISRLYHHLCGTRDSINIQVKGDEVALEHDLAVARMKDPIPNLDKIKANHLKSSAGKYRFATGLNAALAHVGWLYAQQFDLDAITIERNVLLANQECARVAVEKQREAALNDPDGTTDYDEDMWQELTWLIGPTPEDD